MNNKIVNIDHFENRQLSEIAIKCETKKDFLKIILEGEKNRIRDCISLDESSTRTNLQKSIFGIAEIYTTAQLTENINGKTVLTDSAKLVLSECMKLTIDKFSSIGIPEILEAFRSAASGEIEANLNAYYGKFTVAMYCDVIKAYMKRRNKIISKYDNNIRLIESRKEDDKKEEKNKEAHDEIVKSFWNFVEMGSEGIEITLDEIPFYWGRILDKKGIIKATPEEKLSIYKESEKYLIDNLKAGCVDDNKTPSERKTIRTELTKILQNKATFNKNYQKTLKSKIDAIYCKKIVLFSIKKYIEIYKDNRKPAKEGQEFF